MLQRALSLTLLLSTCLGLSPAASAAYPDRPIRIIVPFPAGDGLDLQARMIGQRLTERWGQQVIVDNKPGAATLIGVESARQAPADGYTLLLVTTSYTINPSLRDKVPYDPIKDFAPLMQTTAIPLILVGSNKFAPDNFTQVLALARQKPGALTIGNSGIGTAAHIGMELLNSATGTTVIHVPYKGIPPALVDLMSGDLQMLSTSPAQVLGAIRDGKVKALAVTGSKRLSHLPEVGTVKEAGVPNYEVSAWVGLMVPAGVPQDILLKLNREIASILAMPEVKEKLMADGSEVVASTPDEFGRHIRAELDKWGTVIRAAGIKVP